MSEDKDTVMLTLEEKYRYQIKYSESQLEYDKSKNKWIDKFIKIYLTKLWKEKSKKG